MLPLSTEKATLETQGDIMGEIEDHIKHGLTHTEEHSETSAWASHSQK